MDTRALAPTSGAATGSRTTDPRQIGPGSPGLTSIRPSSNGPGATGPVNTSGPSLSPSRAGDFMTCPLLYRFRVLDRLPEPPSLAATRGTLVHAVLERLFDLPAGERTMDHAKGLLRPAWDMLLEEEPDRGNLVANSSTPPLPSTTLPSTTEWLRAAEDLLGRYFALEDPTRLEPAERELYVETRLASGLLLRGYVDRLDVAPGSGDVRVVDYKTGRAPGPGFEARALFQMRFYALVLWRTSGRVPRLLQLIYLGSGEILRYSPDEADLLATERKVDAVWAAIERAHRDQDWRASPSRLCEWCAHQALCPAFGGSPPPVPASGPAPQDPHRRVALNRTDAV